MGGDRWEAPDWPDFEELEEVGTPKAAIRDEGDSHNFTGIHKFGRGPGTKKKPGEARRSEEPAPALNARGAGPPQRLAKLKFRAPNRRER